MTSELSAGMNRRREMRRERELSGRIHQRADGEVSWGTSMAFADVVGRPKIKKWRIANGCLDHGGMMYNGTGAMGER